MSNKFSKWNLQKMQGEGKIRSFTETRIKGMPGHSGDQRSAGKEWVSWNLQYWANERSLEIRSKDSGGELIFHPDRKWRFDFAIPAHKIAIEYEGGIFRQYEGGQGAHGSAEAFTRDMDKYNEATILGWRVLRIGATNYKNIIALLNRLIK